MSTKPFQCNGGWTVLCEKRDNCAHHLHWTAWPSCQVPPLMDRSGVEKKVIACSLEKLEHFHPLGTPVPRAKATPQQELFA